MRVLIVGSGLIGRRIAATVAAGGDEPVLASRNGNPGAGLPSGRWVSLDITDRSQCAEVVDRVRPEAVVLVHGPSDVTWCEENPARAMHDHTTAALNLAGSAGTAKVLLISTDNVFDGGAAWNDESATTRPTNAYGRAKLAAELALRDRLPDATVLRVSLVYGWEPPGASTWLNFFAACAHRLRRGLPVEAPGDLWTTPVLVDDVAAVTTGLLRDPAGRLLHLGGPDRVSRADWARVIAEEAGVDPGLVRSVARAQSRYACRPTNSCLRSVVLDSLACTRDIPVRGVRQAARLLVTSVEPAS
ncbi:SDR family oxidoreductase [Micromonospora sp. WMMD723]|uniref:SDR family oxidoreductase n=1 Tax=Micromonospora sp. WMMD723 TaxID=3403465 RepID=UPI003CEFBDD0